jgi:hypothetical protein
VRGISSGFSRKTCWFAKKYVQIYIVQNFALHWGYMTLTLRQVFPHNKLLRSMHPSLVYIYVHRENSTNINIDLEKINKNWTLNRHLVKAHLSLAKTKKVELFKMNRFQNDISIQNHTVKFCIYIIDSQNQTKKEPSSWGLFKCVVFFSLCYEPQPTFGWQDYPCKGHEADVSWYQILVPRRPEK